VGDLEPLTPRPGEAWQRWEIDALVASYFAMLVAEERGERPVKAEFNRRLRDLLTARTHGSIEYKLQNVSAVLDDQHLLFIDGYKPARNFQDELRRAVLAWTAGNRVAAEELANYGTTPPPAIREVTRLSDVLVPAPIRRTRGPAQAGLSVSQGEWGALRDMRLRSLGEAGEQWVSEIERLELAAVGRNDLAARVEWTAKERGDGYGYDVASFEADGTPIQIEVKTTNLGQRAPFYVTRNEVQRSEELAPTYRLYRVFDFAREPRVFIMPGAVERSFMITPMVYQASLR
jgi:hypothetical protein